MSFGQKLKHLLPSYRRAQESDMNEELQSLAAIAGPGELGNLTQSSGRGARGMELDVA